MLSAEFSEKIRESLPPVFAISELKTRLPGIIAPGTVHNCLSKKIGPPHEKVNGRVVLERDSFVDWLVNRPRLTPAGEVVI